MQELPPGIAYITIYYVGETARGVYQRTNEELVAQLTGALCTLLGAFEELTDKQRVVGRPHAFDFDEPQRLVFTLFSGETIRKASVLLPKK